MHLVFDPREAQRIDQDVKRRREGLYREVHRSKRGPLSWLKNRRIRAYRRGATDLWDLYELADIVLDDGIYLDEVLSVGDSALGIVIGGHTGFLAFSDCTEIRGRSIQHSLKWHWWHRTPVVGGALRHRWARRLGVVPARPAWVPRM